MKTIFLVPFFVLLISCVPPSANESETKENVAERGNIEGQGNINVRTEQAREKLHTLVSPNYRLSSGPDAEFMAILENFIWGEVFYHGSLTDRQRIIILLSVMTTNQDHEQFGRAAASAVRNGILTPVEVKEIVYMHAPYIGFPKVLTTLIVVNEILTQQGITLPLESQSTVTEETRYERGLEIQNRIIGGNAEQMFLNNAPENQRHIYEYLTAMGFGDIFSRSGLDLQTRQMIVFVILGTLGDTERQLRGHIRGNLNVGNNKEFLIDVLTQMLPYIGFPRTLNVLSLLNEVEG